MSEPISTGLGIKLTWTLGGFAGGIVSLSFLKNLTRPQAFLAVFTGAAAATYLTPIACGWFGVVNEQYQNGVAFVIGLCSMNIIPLIQSTVDRFARQKSDAVAPEGESK